MADKRATIIYNPVSGRSGRRTEAARRMVELLAVRGIKADAQATAGPDDATRLARQATSEGAEIIVSYGGDGTLNEVLQGMVGSAASLAVWPGGTSNVVATDLGISPGVEQIANMIADGKTKRVSLGVDRDQVKDEGGGMRDEKEYEASNLKAQVSISDSTSRVSTVE